MNAIALKINHPDTDLPTPSQDPAATWRAEMVAMEAEIAADMREMEATQSGWYAPAGPNEPPDFDAWLDTPAGQAWLERQADAEDQRAEARYAPADGG